VNSFYSPAFFGRGRRRGSGVSVRAWNARPDRKMIRIARKLRVNQTDAKRSLESYSQSQITEQICAAETESQLHLRFVCVKIVYEVDAVSTMNLLKTSYEIAAWLPALSHLAALFGESRNSREPGIWVRGK